MTRDMSRSLPNYIRSFRRRAGLYQDDLAFLLGTNSGTAVLRHERNQRLPSLDTALRYSAIFRVDPRELFAGRYEVAEEAVYQQAKILLAGASKSAPNGSEPRVAFLSALVGDPEPRWVPCEEE